MWTSSAKPYYLLGLDWRTIMSLLPLSIYSYHGIKRNILVLTASNRSISSFFRSNFELPLELTATAFYVNFSCFLLKALLLWRRGKLFSFFDCLALIEKSENILRLNWKRFSARNLKNHVQKNDWCVREARETGKRTLNFLRRERIRHSGCPKVSRFVESKGEISIFE